MRIYISPSRGGSLVVDTTELVHGGRIWLGSRERNAVRELCLWPWRLEPTGRYDHLADDVRVEYYTLYEEQ